MASGAIPLCQKTSVHDANPLALEVQVACNLVLGHVYSIQLVDQTAGLADEISFYIGIAAKQQHT
jgi:hypothetical protein